jgi:hypothetical protein
MPIEGSFFCVEVGDDHDDDQHAVEVYGPFADHAAAHEWIRVTLRKDETRVMLLVLPPAQYPVQRREDDKMMGEDYEPADGEPADGSHAQYCQETAEAQGFTASMWSYRKVMFGEPHVFPGRTEMWHRSWNDPEPLCEPIPGPLWLDIWKAADRLIARSRNHDHRFIEGLRQDANDPRRLILVTGNMP